MTETVSGVPYSPIRVVLALAALAAAMTPTAHAGAVSESSAALPGDDGEPASFAVVELFTSQGCNSCPRADRALARLVEESDGHSIFPLEWHVHYWDYLGWADPYALPEAAARQRRYSQMLNSGVYTPQMVLNGRSIVRPAQDYDLVRSAAFAALGPKPAAAGALPRVQLSAASHDGQIVRVRYRATGVPAGCALTVAAVQHAAENFVPHGENGGRTLSHRNVVRGFATVYLQPGESAGQVRITLPQLLTPDGGSLIAYVQRQATLGIVAATALP